MKKSIVKNIMFTLMVSALLLSCGKKTEETTPTVQDITETVFAAGSLEADGMYSLTAQTTGYITQLNFEEGDIVLLDSVLAEIENKENLINTVGAANLLSIAQSNANSNGPLLLQAQYNIDITKLKMEQDDSTAQQYKRLLQSNSISQKEFDNISLNYQTSKTNYQTAVANYNKIKSDANQQVVSSQISSGITNTAADKNQIKAIVGGMVYKKNKQLGDFVRQGDVIAQIGSPSLLYAKVNIDESNISKIKLGQKATIQLNTNKDKSYKGVVNEILPSFDDATQSFICKVYFIDSLDFKIINTQLQTNITIMTHEDAILIPRNYIDFGGYVQIKGQQEKTKVITQFVSNEWVQVLSGIDANTALVTENLFTEK
ncbi:MAG: HlyD family secretion protein [Flavobacteriales bacterium]|jgi:HlyD family secretion protein